MVPANDVEKEYFTMSSNGITGVRPDGETGKEISKKSNFSKEFTSMAQWVREADVYEIVSRLDVFRTYRHWKTFRKWRSYIRKRRLKVSLILNPIFLTKRRTK